MSKKQKPWPKCCAPLCKAEADVGVYAGGDHGEFEGAFCNEHYDAFKSCFPARHSHVGNLRPILVSDLERMLGDQR